MKKEEKNSFEKKLDETPESTSKIESSETKELHEKISNLFESYYKRIEDSIINKEQESKIPLPKEQPGFNIFPQEFGDVYANSDIRKSPLRENLLYRSFKGNLGGCKIIYNSEKKEERDSNLQLMEEYENIGQSYLFLKNFTKERMRFIADIRPEKKTINPSNLELLEKIENRLETIETLFKSMIESQEILVNELRAQNKKGFWKRLFKL